VNAFFARISKCFPNNPLLVGVQRLHFLLYVELIFNLIKKRIFHHFFFTHNPMPVYEWKKICAYKLFVKIFNSQTEQISVRDGLRCLGECIKCISFCTGSEKDKCTRSYFAQDVVNKIDIHFSDSSKKYIL